MGEEYDPHAFVAIDEDGCGKDSVEYLFVEDMVGGKGAFGGVVGVVLAEGFGADSGGSAFQGAVGLHANA